MFHSLNKFLNFFGGNKKKYYYFFIFSNLLITFLEMVGIGIIFPILKVIIDPLFTLKIKEYDITIINNLNSNEILMLMLIVMSIIFAINFLIGILSWANKVFFIFAK